MTHPQVYYMTVTEALDELRRKGFNIDFNLEENCLVCGNEKLQANDFEIAEIYRYEGQTDPADEVSVYGIESKSGLKGVFIAGYGAYTSALSSEILRKLH